MNKETATELELNNLETISGGGIVHIIKKGGEILEELFGDWF
jgi:hypothetical protein